MEGNWSAEFKNFVSICLVKKPKMRATGKSLLEHPFLAKAQDAEFLRINFLRDLKPVDERDIATLQAQGIQFKKTLNHISQPKASQIKWDYGPSADNLKQTTPQLQQTPSKEHQSAMA